MLTPQAASSLCHRPVNAAPDVNNMSRLTIRVNNLETVGLNVFVEVALD